MCNNMCYIFHKAIEELVDKLFFHIAAFMQTIGYANKTKI